jgi:hypothetical protein
MNCILPPLSIPVRSPVFKDERTILCLYYRWALQTLSALQFMHSRSIYFSDLCAYNVWIRPDFSIAVGGFASACCGPAVAETSEEQLFDWHSGVYYLPNGGPSRCGGQFVEYTDEAGQPKHGVQYDLFDWATFIWRLMSNEHCDPRPPQVKGHRVEPIDEMNPAERPIFVHLEDDFRYLKQRQKERAWQVLEEERLGSVLVKAWNTEYRDAGEAMHDIKLILERLQVKVAGEDEVLLDNGTKWEDAITIAWVNDGCKAQFQLVGKQAC